MKFKKHLRNISDDFLRNIEPAEQNVFLKKNKNVYDSYISLLTNISTFCLNWRLESTYFNSSGNEFQSALPRNTREFVPYRVLLLGMSFSVFNVLRLYLFVFLSRISHINSESSFFFSYFFKELKCTWNIISIRKCFIASIYQLYVTFYNTLEQITTRSSI